MDNKTAFYNLTLNLAKKSPCKKMGFGCVLVPYGGFEPIYTCNAPMPWAQSVCDPDCIRIDIPSRTHSMIGACGHAEERAIWECIEWLGSAVGADVYVNGVAKPANQPMLDYNNGFTCIQCATIMCYAKINRVYWWVGEDRKLVSQTPEEAYKSALEFAKRKV